MALMFTLITIGFASVLAPIVYIIFKFTTKEKTFDEVIAEQRKQLALENSFKTKGKYHQSKKNKNSVKSSDKRNKSVTFSQHVVKETKKMENLKNNTVSTVEKDSSTSAAKKKPDKSHWKSNVAHGSALNSDKTVQESANEDSGNTGDNNDDNNNSKKNYNYNGNADADSVENFGRHERVSIRNAARDENREFTNNNSKGNIADKGGGGESTVVDRRVDDVSSGCCNNMSKDKVSIAKNLKCSLVGNPPASENTDGQSKGKFSTVDSEKSKKANPKPENDENTPKSNGNTKLSSKAEEKNVKETKVSRFKPGEEKLNKNEEKSVKVDKENKLEEKLHLSPSKSSGKNFEAANPVTSTKTSAEVSLPAASSPNTVDEESKNKNDSKKQDDKIVPSNLEHGVDKEKESSSGAPKIEKLSSNVAKKQNGNSTVATNPVSSNGNVGGGAAPVSVRADNKIGLTTAVKGSRQLNGGNGKITKRQTPETKTWPNIDRENNEPINVNLLVSLIAKAELSRSEIQNLIDLLLNKQQETRVIDAEWIEGGRQDPVVKLKKQLAEKEKALGDEQEAHQAIQSKLKELRNELNLEKHSNRQLEDALNARLVDIQALNSKLQNVSEEKQNFTRQIQQMQTKLNEERMIARSLKEENSKTKNNLQKELLAQRQQLEMHIAHLNEQHQQEMLALDNQLNQLASQLQEHEANSAQMNEEIRECVLLRERLVHQENQIAHLQQTIIQLEELRSIKAELERHLASSQYDVTRLSNELKSVTDQLNRRNAEMEKYNCTIQNMKIENQELMKENSRNGEQIKFAYNEKVQLQVEIEKLSNDLKELQERRAVNDVETLENELKTYQNAFEEKKAEVSRLNERLAELENMQKQLISRNASLEEQSRFVNQVKENLEKQQQKNHELRCKNWKVMEALSSMEKTLESKVKGMQCLPHEIKTKERGEILKRINGILPDLAHIYRKPGDPLAEDDMWFPYVEKLLIEIRKNLVVERITPVPSHGEDLAVVKENNVLVLDELEKQNKQLQTMVGHYKSIISDTEGMLNSLQNHVEREENRWSEQVQLLQAELKSITEERDFLLRKTKVQNGVVENDNIRDSEQKVINGIDRLPPLLSTSLSGESTTVTR